jgi:hypothetical protein
MLCQIGFSGKCSAVLGFGSIGILEINMACHYTPNPINYDVRNKSIPELVPVVTIEVLHGGTILKNEDFRK